MGTFTTIEAALEYTVTTLIPMRHTERTVRGARNAGRNHHVAATLAHGRHQDRAHLSPLWPGGCGVSVR
jgi:hypothetical protein